MSTWTRDDLPDFSGVDWRAMYEVASRERDEAERERDSWRERAEKAEQKYGTERLRWERAREHHADESRKWGEKRRAYEAQIAELEVAGPTVTREQVEQAIRGITCDVMNYDPPARIGSDSSRLNALLADRICGLFGIEGERDPVERKAAEWARAVGIDWSCAEPEGVDLLMRVAAHVLGQEADDE